MSQQQDKAFIVTFIAVIAALVAVTVALITLASVGGQSTGVAQEREALEYERAEARLQPVGAVRLTGEPMPEIAGAETTPAASEDLTAQQVYDNYCMSCHAAGVMNAPRVGNEGDWASRFQERGLDGLVENAINGLNAMPPRGGNPRLSDDDIRETVQLMLSESGIDS